MKLLKSYSLCFFSQGQSSCFNLMSNNCCDPDSQAVTRAVKHITSFAIQLKFLKLFYNVSKKQLKWNHIVLDLCSTFVRLWKRVWKRIPTATWLYKKHFIEGSDFIVNAQSPNSKRWYYCVLKTKGLDAWNTKGLPQSSPKRKVLPEIIFISRQNESAQLSPLRLLFWKLPEQWTIESSASCQQETQIHT